jgi:rubrerythrin
LTRRGNAYFMDRAAPLFAGRRDEGRCALSKTDENLKLAFANESQTNVEYLAYAHQAIHEGLMEVAQLFREAAGAEIVHALSHLKVMGAVQSTKENLREAAEAEDLEILSMYPKFIEEAESEGNVAAAKSFRIAYEREKHHRAMFRQALKQMR